MTAVLPRAVAAEYPFARHWLQTDHGRLHYVDEGPRDAPVVLLLHGNPTWSFYYRTLIRALSDDYRLVAPDHLGCGLSDKPRGFSYRLHDHIENIERLVDQLALSDITLAVHDWGGAIGMGLAVEAPERFVRFTVFNTAAFLSERIPMSINLCRLPVFGSLIVRGFNGFARVALRRCIVHRDRLTPAVRAGYLAPYPDWSSRVAHLRFVQDIPMRLSHPTRARLARIEERLPRLVRHPMLIAWGAQDFCFDDTFYEEWRRRFPRACARYIPDAGHYVVEDAHERIAGWMRALLRGPAKGPR